VGINGRRAPVGGGTDEPSKGRYGAARLKGSPGLASASGRGAPALGAARLVPPTSAIWCTPPLNRANRENSRSGSNLLVQHAAGQWPVFAQCCHCRAWVGRKPPSAVFVTTERHAFSFRRSPVDLAPVCARSLTLSSMLALDRQAMATALSHPSSRSTDRGGASQSEFERDLHQDTIKRVASPQLLRGAFRPDAGRAGQFVRRVAAESDKVRHLLWIDAISLPHLLGPDTREFGAPRRVPDSCR
jgi:hypothetical protein